MPVPEEALPGLDEVRARAIGLAEFDDEKAVIWTVFSHLLQSEGASVVWPLFGETSGWPSALLWGGEALGEQAEYAREKLVEKSPSWAPDVLLEFWPAGLVIVVARHLKPNREVRDGQWNLDEDAFADQQSAKLSGRLDLARAWQLGWQLAGPRRFTLVNLLGVPERVQQKAATDLFVSSLREKDDRIFRQLSWRRILNQLPRPWPAWFDAYTSEKQLR
jgi:hypothetical protein